MNPLTEVLMLFLLSLLLLSAPVAESSDWYNVRLTYFTPDDPMVRGTKTTTGEWPKELLAAGKCTLAGSSTYYPLREIYDVQIHDRAGKLVETKRCMVRTRGVHGQYHLDLLIASNEVDEWAHERRDYQLVRRVR